MPIISAFIGEFRFLSNFWPVSISYEGDTYPSVEHAFQAAKTSDAEIRNIIRNAPTPGRAKRLGRSAQLRSDWGNKKLDIMSSLVEQKFFYENLANKLIATAPAIIIEGNSWNDRYWGVCDGYGDNHLGRILMETRKRLMQ